MGYRYVIFNSTLGRMLGKVKDELGSPDGDTYLVELISDFSAGNHGNIHTLKADVILSFDSEVDLNA